MWRFFVKKAFFDGWDHLLGLVLVNALVLFAALPLALLARVLPMAGLLLGTLSLAAFLVMLAVSAEAGRRWTDYGDLSFRDLGTALRRSLLPAVEFGALSGLLILALGVGVPFWLSRGLLGALAAGVLLWVGLAFALALPYYLPLRLRFGGSPAKNLRKSFYLLADNPAFSLFLLVWTLVGLGLSLFSAFLIPGIAGVVLGWHGALRLLLAKYEWLEGRAAAGAGEAPAARSRRPSVIWKEALAEEEELIGPRTLRGMIFPWKE